MVIYKLWCLCQTTCVIFKHTPTTPFANSKISRITPFMEAYSFNITDGIAIAIVLGSALFALIRGFVSEVLGIYGE